MTTTTQLPQTEYDYIVCGGGTSGSVVAARLAEDPAVSVLLIEAGKHSNLVEGFQMAGDLWFNRNQDASKDWGFVNQPGAETNYRTIRLLRGRFLGGCSSTNATLCVRGVKDDYNNWGLEGWSGEEFWREMNRAERFHPKEGFEYDAESHGMDGYVHTAHCEVMPISLMVLDSMVDRGLPLVPDMFTSGHMAHGCGHFVRSVHDGIRSTAGDFVISAGPNLVVLTETTVDIVNLANENGEWRATGVDVIGKDGSKITLGARKEVIVSGGAYCSPAILLRSGIGAKAEVESFGIESKVDLLGVGKNLLDHIIVALPYQISEPFGMDHETYTGRGLQTARQLWTDTKTGVLAQIPIGVGAFVRLDERLKDSPLWNDAPREEGLNPMGLTPNQPTTELLTVEYYLDPRPDAVHPTAAEFTTNIVTMLFSPRSKGFVTLKSKDPLENPAVDHRFLEDPLDLLVMSEACQFANEVMVMGEGTRDIVVGSWPPAKSHHLNTCREDWVPYVKERATTCFHPGGTVKMGRKEDLLAVVDERLRVRGVRGLRVADVSIMPTLNSGHTQMPAYGIGEKCAAMLKEDNEVRGA